MKDINVLHVTESYGGGVFSAINAYVQATPEIQHHIAVRERSDAPISNSHWRHQFASVTFLPDSHIAALGAVKNLIDTLRPDVVHSHSSYGGLYARWSGHGGLRLKQVYTPHGWAFIRQDHGVLARSVYWLIEALLGIRTDCLAACSRDEARVAPLQRQKITVIPNVVSVPKADSADITDYPMPEGPGPLVVGSGRLRESSVQAKDPEYFMRAVSAVRRGGHAVRAQWIGGGEPAMEQRLRDNGIYVTGWCTPEQTTALLGRADLYLHSALWDGFPLTVLDAHSQRVPTLLRDIDAFREIDWPFKLGKPDDLAGLWPRLMSEDGRKILLDSADHALRENTAAVQRERLLAVYGLDPSAFSAGEEPTATEHIASGRLEY